MMTRQNIASRSPPTQIDRSTRQLWSRSVREDVKALRKWMFLPAFTKLFLPTSETIGQENKEERTSDTEPNKGSNSFFISVLYGMINASIVTPVTISFASIIYRDHVFSPHMPILVKLCVISSIVHQLCFSTFSSLPFAVGQVQDAGLIFLAAMSGYIVEHCHMKGYDEVTLLATVTVCLSLCTTILGLALMFMGRWQLAQYVKILPTSVIGGYLAYIGWFCGTSGVRLMAGSDDLTVVQAVLKLPKFVLPGLLGGIFIYVSVRRLKHMIVLPTCILLMLAIFYAALWMSATTIQEAMKQGWIRAIDPPPVWYQTWDYLRLDLVAWSVLPKLFLTELSMIFVVALSSSLDVAAIELELKRPLNYNQELKMVGISNMVSGLAGGYTGSYIFSQTIFSLRAGIQSRTDGYALAAFQAILFIFPFSLLYYVPNFFFGSLLIMICMDLLCEWLWDVRTRVTIAEYIINLITFGMIQCLGVELGILAGIGLHNVYKYEQERKRWRTVEEEQEDVIESEANFTI